MEESTSREKVLKKIRNALLEKQENPFTRSAFDAPIYPDPAESIDLSFVEAFNRVDGRFIYCENTQELEEALSELARIRNWSSLLCQEEKLIPFIENAGLRADQSLAEYRDAGAGVISCEALIARTGSIMVSSRQGGGRRMNAFPDTQIVIGYTSQLVPDIEDGLAHIQKQYGPKIPSMISMITGPSRTADIEKTLILGMHGPRELFLILVEDMAEQSL